MYKKLTAKKDIIALYMEKNELIQSGVYFIVYGFRASDL
jgi:hypothetical protein